MADITAVAQTYDNAGAEITAARVSANAFKTLGDGAAGIGPYTRFGTRQLQAIKIVSASVDFTTTPAISNSNMSKAVAGLLAGGAEVFYIGKPTASGANQFVALVALDTANPGGRGADSIGGTADTANTSYETLEESVSLRVAGANADITITNVELTGLTFA
jgi:hypothetical protein